MTIADIRAESTLNGFEIIQGSVGDSFAAGGGWITTTGQVTVLGLESFSIGAEANISTVPRTLYVLGVAPDPYSNTTIVTVGCRLSLLKNQVPDPDTDIEDLDKDQCESDVDTYSASGFRGQGSVVGLSTIFDRCKRGLGLIGDGLLSSIKIQVDKKKGFDFSAGYMQIAESILQSEAKFAYADGTIVRIITPGTAGLYIYDEFLLDLSASSTTDVPKRNALVRYQTIELQPAEEDEDDLPPLPAEDPWSRDETQGDYPATTYYVRFEGGEVEYEYTHSFLSYVLTETEYYPEVEPPENPTCEEKPYEPSREELLSGKISTRTTKTRISVGNNCQAYCEFLIDLEAEPNYELEGYITSTETYSYDEFGELSKVETVTVQPQFMALSDLPNLNGAEGDYIILYDHDVEVSKTVVEYENIYEGSLGDNIYRVGDEAFKLLKGRRTKTKEYVPFYKTNLFRHRLTVLKENGQLNTMEDIERVWNDMVFPLGDGKCRADFLVSATTVTETGSDIQRYVQAKPRGTLSANNGDSVQSKQDTPEFLTLDKSVKFIFNGHNFGNGYTEHSVPFTGDDYYKRFESNGEYSWRKYKGSRSNLSRCASLQHRMAFGRTAAYTAVIPASSSPSRPLFSARIHNLSAQFICAGMTWQLSNAGAVVALDLILWSNTVSGTLPSYPNPINTVWDVTYNSDGSYLTASQISDYLGTTEWYVNENNEVILDPSGTGDYSDTVGNLLLPGGEVVEGNLPPVWIDAEEIDLTTSTFFSIRALNHELTNIQETVDIVNYTKVNYGYEWLYPQPASFTSSGGTAPYIIDRYLPLDAGSYSLDNAADAKLIQYYDDLVADPAVYGLAGYEVNARNFTYELQADPGSFALVGNDAPKYFSRYLGAETGSMSLATLNSLYRTGPGYVEVLDYPFFNGTTNPSSDGQYSYGTHGSFFSSTYGNLTSYYLRFRDNDINGTYNDYRTTNVDMLMEWGPDKTIWTVRWSQVVNYSGYVRYVLNSSLLGDQYHGSPTGTDDLLAAISSAGGMVAFNNPAGVRFLEFDPAGDSKATFFLVYHGSFGVSGGDIQTKVGVTVQVEAGNFALTGQSSGLLRSLRTSLNSGTYAISGQAASIDKGYILEPQAGAFSLTGQSINFVYLRSLSIAAASGAFSLAGQSISFVYLRILEMAAASGAFSLAGQNAELTHVLPLPHRWDAKVNDTNVSCTSADGLYSTNFLNLSGADRYVIFLKDTTADDEYIKTWFQTWQVGDELEFYLGGSFLQTNTIVYRTVDAACRIYFELANDTVVWDAIQAAHWQTELTVQNNTRPSYRS